MTANPILLQKKYSRVIECFAKQQGLSLDAALDFFYHSQVYHLIRDGVSDMHCMSDAYLAEELEQEYAEKNAGYVSDTVQGSVSPFFAVDGEIWILLEVRHNDKIWLINQIKVIYWMHKKRNRVE